MKGRKLTSSQLTELRPLEIELRRAVAVGDSDSAMQIALKIQAIFPNERSHHRLLRAKLWAYEACVDANRLAFAESGLIGIRKLSARSTRLYLEAGALLAIVLLRQHKILDAKEIIRDVIGGINNITSDKTRTQFQKRFIGRIEEECILVELVGSGSEQLNVTDVHHKAVLLIQQSTDDEILTLIGDHVPLAGVQLFSEVRNYSIQQLPPPDRKLLPSPQASESPRNIGKTAFAILRRVAWKTFCKPSSPIFELWSNRIPKVFNEGYFSAAAITALGELRIGIPMLASGLAALAMKYTAEEFCELSKPKGIMISLGEKEDG